MNAATNQLALFDYNTLDAETRIVVQQRTGEIKSLMKRAAQDIIDIGQKLAEVKGRLGHGNFGRWLEAEFDWSDSTAVKMMQVADAFKSVTVTDLAIGTKALYALSAPSTPAAARVEAIERAQTGQTITHSAAQAIIADHRISPPVVHNWPDRYYAPDEDEEAPDEAVIAAIVEEMVAGAIDDGIPEQEARAEVLSVVAPPIAAREAIHQSMSNEWYTPVAYLDAVRDVLGSIDLDPASCAIANQVVQAKHYFTQEHDGFAAEWFGRVFLNPPYGKEVDGTSNQARWSARLLQEFAAGRVSEAILLVNAVPGNAWFKPLWDHVICFTDHRIRFYGPDGEIANQPTHSNVFVYLGANTDRFKALFSRFGVVARRA